MNTKLITNYFKTSDLGLTALLIYNWYKLDSTDKTTWDKVIFYIERDENIDETIQAYFSFNLRVEPIAYFNIQRTLKNRIYN